MSKVNKREFRNKRPTRSKNIKPERNYRKYKTQLRKDFNSKCGYCDDHDEFCGGERGFHIDHFAPKSKFPELTNDYQNLVYSCPYCNGKKLNTWVGKNHSPSHNGTEGFVDPTKSQYDQQFCRDAQGRIIGQTPLGKYMVQNLNLDLMRHAYIWQIAELNRKCDEVNGLMMIPNSSSSMRKELLERYVQISKRIEGYRKRINES